MKNKDSLSIIIILAALGLPIFYLCYIYSSLPETIAIHFNIEGKPDGYGSKTTLVFTTILLDAVGLGCYFLMKYLPQIDPKKTAEQNPALLNKIGIVIVVFMGLLNLIILQSSVSNTIQINKYILPLLGMLFAFMGNYMQTIKPNYFAGFRTPWTLEDPENWKATHLLAGKLWVIGGFVCMISSLLAPAKIGWLLFMMITVIISIVPFIFSYRYFKKHQSK